MSWLGWGILGMFVTYVLVALRAARLMARWDCGNDCQFCWDRVIDVEKLS